MLTNSVAVRWSGRALCVVLVEDVDCDAIAGRDALVEERTATKKSWDLRACIVAESCCVGSLARGASAVAVHADRDSLRLQVAVDKLVVEGCGAELNFHARAADRCVDA